jgi:hypothetical protein
MRFLRAVAVLGIAAGLVAAWMVVQPAVRSATSRLVSATESAIGTTAATPVTYYVKPTGHDHWAGTSPRTAWRTLGRASRAILRPGTRLLLRGGYQYPGSLLINTADAGNVSKPVLVSSYGKGRAEIVSSGNGIAVVDTRGVNIQNLKIVGSHARNAADAGIQMYSTRVKGPLGHVYISKVDIRSFGYGIAIGATHDGAGFRNVHVTYSSVHNNLDGGLVTYGPDYNPAVPGYAHADIFVSHVRAFRNFGDPKNTTHNTGSGIELGSVSGATVVDSQTFDNGGKNGSMSEGPIGMWSYDSTRVIMAHDVSHNNTSASVHDGGGFGLDREVSHSVLEYDLSYDNHGAGFLLYSTPSAPGHQNANVVRFNISYGDVTGHDHVIGALEAEGKVSNSVMYQNTAVVTGSNTQPAFKATGDLHRIKVLNNILVAAKGAVVLATTPLKTSQILFAGNDYFDPGIWVVQWGTHTHYLSLGAWRAATLNEKLNGRRTGHVLAPMFVGPLAPSRGGAGFMLRSRSKLLRAGLNLKLRFGINAGPVTYGGNPYVARTPNIGAQ